MSAQPMVLVIDDDREIVRGLRIRLRAAGYETATAHDGQAGVDAAVRKPPDAIVLDLRMPVLDGFGVLKALQSRDDTRSIPVVVLSANIVEAAKRQALDLGARYFVQKPYEPRRLIEAIDSAMAAPNGDASKPRAEANGIVVTNQERS